MECEIMAYCDVCGNFDESHRESMEYPKDSRHCIQDYQPELYYYWDYPLEEDYDCEILFTQIVYVRYALIYSMERIKSSGSVPVVKVAHYML